MKTGDQDQRPPAEDRSRGETSDDFFCVGAPLHAVRAGYIRRRADDLLYEAVTAGRYAHVIAPDRWGKSSLVAATAARLEANGFNVAILDLEQIGVRDTASDAGRWYYSVAYRLLRQLRIRYDLQAWWQDKTILGNRQRLLAFYNEVILQFVQERVVVFVDEVQCIGSLPFADQLLASIRSAHNARTTDPEFSRLTFVLLGECDAHSLVEKPEMSPFSVTQAIPLDDFSRKDLNLFATELNMSAEDAEQALDRIFHWTSGQPYLSQKLARAVARDRMSGPIDECVDALVAQQLTGRAAIHSEPHLSHIHREIVTDPKRNEALLNLYGRLRKGVDVVTDLGSPLQRKLIALGLIVVDEHGELRVRNRIYEAVFTARWANENLPTHWRGPLLAVAAMLAILAVPFWYTQWLPGPYVDVLTSPDVDLQAAESTWLNFRSFPGHSGAADNLYRNFLQTRAKNATDVDTINAIAVLAEELPAAGTFAQELPAAYWDQRVLDEVRYERRDAALMAALQSLVLSTPQRRQRAATLVADDYPMLLASLQSGAGLVFDPVNLLLTSTNGAAVSQWRLLANGQGLERSEDWTMTALEVSPLVRRVILDREGSVSRIGLSLNISHPRMDDLRIKLIAPSGRAVEIEPGRAAASSGEEIRIPTAQLSGHVGEQLGGTWSLSIRDEAPGVAGYLAGWNLTLNSQGAVEDFQRGIGIPDPVEREAGEFWVSDDGRYAVARATQSDSARIWDLAFAKPVRAIPIGQNERPIGLDAGARRLVTATLETVNLWNTSTGDRLATLETGATSMSSRLTSDGLHLFVQRRSDLETTLELWSLEQAARSARLDIAGSPALIALDSTGSRIAIADFDRAVRIWDFASGELLAQIDLPSQPSEIRLAPGGNVLGAVHGNTGVSLWRVDRPAAPLLEDRGRGAWQLVFSPSGSRIAAGRPRMGFQVYRSADGFRIGPSLGAGAPASGDSLLAFSEDERMLLTGMRDGMARLWRIATPPATSEPAELVRTNPAWAPAGDSIVVSTPDASRVVIGDRGGHVHVMPADAAADALTETIEEVSFLGHDEPVRRLEVSADGSLVASAAADNTVRVWEIADGQPRAYLAEIAGSPLRAIRFSPDTSRIAVLNGEYLRILDSATGGSVAEFALDEAYSGITFADDEHLYVGGESGRLQVISRQGQDAWSMQQLWQGSAPIRLLAASPQGRYLVLVDSNNRAQQFNLQVGRLGKRVIELPDTVQDMTFSPFGTRVLFRTSRWIHRATSAASGLIWLDAIYGPRPSRGGRIVFGTEMTHGNAFYVPVANATSVNLARLQFSSDDGPGLFGNMDELIDDWGVRLGLEAAPATD